MGDAIHAVSTVAEIQHFIVHHIRYYTKFISYKDIKVFMSDLKLVYKVDSEEVQKVWGKNYRDRFKFCVK